MTQPALHLGPRKIAKAPWASRIAVLPRDSQARSGVFASMDAWRYTAPGAAFIVLRSSSLSTLAVSSAKEFLATELLRDSQRTSVRGSNAG
jgi:hypothetical protein